MPTLRVPVRGPIQSPGRLLYKARSGAPSDTGAKSDVRVRLALGVVFLLAIVLRLINLGHSYWGDENATLQLLRDSPVFMVVHGIARNESTPPLYYLIASIWSHLFGISEVAVRSLTALIGVATVAVAYAIGAELRSRRAGVILAALVAVSPLMVWYSQDARAYGLAILLTSLGLLFFAQALRTGSSKSLWFWAGASAVALTSHYFAIFVIVPEAVALLVPRKTRSRALWPSVVVAATWVALVPLLLYQRSHAGHLAWIGFLSLNERLKMTLQFFDTGSWDVRFLVLVGLTAMVAVVIAVAFLAHRIHRRELVILGVGASGILLPVLASAAGFDYVNYQNLIVAWMPFAAVLAVAVAGWRRVGTLLALGILGFSLAATVKVQATPALQRPNWRLAAKTLSAEPPDTLVAIYPASDITPLQWYDRDASIVRSGSPGTIGLPGHVVVWTRRIVVLAEDPWVYSAAHTLVLRPPAGFHQIKKTYFSTFVLDSYSAPHPVAVAVKRLAATRPSGYLLNATPWQSTVFLDHRAPARRLRG